LRREHRLGSDSISFDGVAVLVAEMSVNQDFT
jgi:hypothetical protein